MGLFEVFEEILDWVIDWFGDPEDALDSKPTTQKPSGPSSVAASEKPAQPAFWEKTSRLISPEFLQELSNETGWSTLKLGMKIQGPCSEVLQRWQNIGRPITDQDLQAMRREIREKILQH